MKRIQGGLRDQLALTLTKELGRSPTSEELSAHFKLRFTALAWQIVDHLTPRLSENVVSTSHLVKVMKVRRIMEETSGSLTIDELINRAGIEFDTFVDDSYEHEIGSSPMQEEEQKESIQKDSRKGTAL